MTPFMTFMSLVVKSKSSKCKRFIFSNALKPGRVEAYFRPVALSPSPLPQDDSQAEVKPTATGAKSHAPGSRPV